MTSILSVREITSGYQDVVVLRDVSLEVAPGEIVAVVGANGAGKSTLLRTISGLIRPRAGSIVFEGKEIAGTPAHRIVEERLILVPEGGRLFPFMTVQENLELGAHNSHARPDMADMLAAVMDRFPILAQRCRQQAGSLSGGERTMCAIARGMMSKPRLMMMDEPSLGLSPLMVKHVFSLVAELAASFSIPILLVEQNVNEALKMAARAYVVEQGRIVRSGTGAELLADAGVRKAYLGA